MNEILYQCPCMLLFDQGYPSIEFIHFLEKQKVNYLFRLSCNDYKKERSEMQTTDKTVSLIHTVVRLNKIKKTSKNHQKVKRKEGNKRRKQKL